MGSIRRFKGARKELRLFTAVSCAVFIPWPSGFLYVIICGIKYTVYNYVILRNSQGGK